MAQEVWGRKLGGAGEICTPSCIASFETVRTHSTSGRGDMMHTQAMALRGSRAGAAGEMLETAVKWVTEWPASLLVVVEIGLLLANVTYRYALHDPLTWGDELASVLFIWLAMFGAVIALRRGEHMRLTTMLEKLTPALRRPLEAFGDALVVVFMLLLIGPAWEYVNEEWAITTPALEIPNGVRVAALAVGFTLMLAIAVSRLAMRTRLRDIMVSAVAIAALSGLLLAFKPLLTGAGHANLLLFFVVGVSGMVVIGVPIMTAFGLLTVGFLAFATDIPSMVAVGRIDEGMSGLILLSVPLFVFLGALIEATGMAAAMIRLLASLTGHETARRRRGRAGGDAQRLRCNVRDDPAQPGADHDRLRHRNLDRGTLHRRLHAGHCRCHRDGDRGVAEEPAARHSGRGCPRFPARSGAGARLCVAGSGLAFPDSRRSRWRDRHG